MSTSSIAVICEVQVRLEKPSSVLDWRTIGVNGTPGFLAIRGSDVLAVSAAPFWPWAYGLVGVTLEGAPPVRPRRYLLDFDESFGAETVYGLHVQVHHADGRSREVELSPDDFWTELGRLAGQITNVDAGEV